MCRERRRPRGARTGDARRQPLRRRARARCRAATCRVRSWRSTRRFARTAPAASAASRSSTSSARATGASCSPSPTRSPRPAPSSTSATRTPTPTRCWPSRPCGRRTATVRLAATGVAGTPDTPARPPSAQPTIRPQRELQPPSEVDVRGRRARVGLVSREDAAGARAPRAHDAQGVGMNLSVNGESARDRERSACDAPRRPARGALDRQPEGELRGGRLRRLHRPDRRRASARVPDRCRHARRRRGHDRRRHRDAGRARTAAAGVHAPLRLAVRLLHAGDADGRAGVHREAAAPTIARRSRRRSSGTSAAARATSRSSTRSPRSRGATRSTSR